jgi:hypothetical protein
VQLDVFVGVGAASGRVEGAKSLIDELIVQHFFHEKEYRTENTIVASLSH